MTTPDFSSAAPPRVLLLPGWQGSGPDHWQTHWERLHSDERVQQDDWQWPKRGDWMAQLDVAVLSSPQPAVLVAHSLGCHLVAAWAAHSQHTARVRAALLVAPPDVQQPDWPPQLASWRVPVLQRLAVRSLVLASTDDPYASEARAAEMAAAWGSEWLALGPLGHVNDASGLGEWPQGRAILRAWVGAAI